MITFTFCFLLILMLFFGIRKLKYYFTQKYHENLAIEISNDLKEEFDLIGNPNDFLNWVEEFQLEDELVRKKHKR